VLLCGYRLGNVGVQQNRGTNLVGIFWYVSLYALSKAFRFG
jgi:hypothetical protein